MHLITPSLPCLRQLVSGNLPAAARESGLEFDGRPWPDDVEMREGLAVHLSSCEHNPRDLLWRVYMIAGDDAIVVGHAGFKGGPSRSGEVEMYWCVEPRYRGKGIGKAAAASLSHYAFEQRAVAAITATIARHNVPSQRVAAALGMREVTHEMKHGLPLWRLSRDAWIPSFGAQNAPMDVRLSSSDPVSHDRAM